MGIQIEIQKLTRREPPVLLNRRPTVLPDATRTPFNAGGEEFKWLVEGVFGRGYEVSLVERLDDCWYERNWRIFREAGLPVVNTLRKGSKDNIFVTDVKADGGEVYGKGLKLVLEEGEPRVRPRPEIDKIFLDIMTPQGQEEIEEAVNEYVDLASENRIVLPRDDSFELLVHPNREWELIILDLTEGWVAEDHETVRYVKGKNKMGADWFLERLFYLKKMLATSR